MAARVAEQVDDANSDASEIEQGTVFERGGVGTSAVVKLLDKSRARARPAPVAFVPAQQPLQASQAGRVLMVGTDRRCG